jgi:DNA polymerase III epsilon subunit-like protein
MLEDKRPFCDSYAHYKLREYIDRWDILVAHNAPYDVAVIENEWVVVEKYIDTLRVARHVLDDEWIESYWLQYLRYFYHLDALHEWELTDGFAHSAMYDTIVLKWLFKFIFEKMKSTYLYDTDNIIINCMVELTNTPVLIKTFTFGKHAWKTIKEVSKTSPDYLEWLLSSELKKPENEQNEDMIYTIRHWL